MGFLWAILMPLLITSAGVVVKIAMGQMSGKAVVFTDVLPVAMKAAPWAFFVASLRFSTQSLSGNYVLVLDVRTGEPARGYVRDAPMRQGALTDGITITEGSLLAAALKSAVAASARLIIRDRWDSPFTGIATGFALPLAAGGELYGVLDIGYAPGGDVRSADEPSVQAFASHLAIALRTLRLADDALGLRDYQARRLEHATALILGIDRRWRVTAGHPPPRH